MFRNEKLQRAISALVLTTFTSMTLAPAMAAAQTAPAATGLPAGWEPLQARVQDNANRALLPLDKQGLPLGKGQVAAKPAARMGRGSTDGYMEAMERFEDFARRPAAADGAAHASALRVQYLAVAAQSATATAAFAATEAHLLKAGVPAEIVQRHRAAAADFAARDAELRAAVNGLGQTEAGGGVAASTQRVNKLLDGYRGANRPAPGASKSLPWGHGKPAKAKPVAFNARQFEDLFPRSVLLASNGSLSGIDLPDAIPGEQPEPADLAETDEVRLTPEIRALAAKLGNHPVQIYNWARNNVRYTPGYGVMQGSAATLQGLRGNAYDTASLLIALNRAAGIPSRFVYGTVEVPLARMQRWLGVQDAAAVQALLLAAGIPHQSLVAGGQVAAIQFEHVWVRAHADFSPSRGAVGKSAGDWVALDASFKLSQDKAALDLRAAVALNEPGLLDGVKAGATCLPDQARDLNTLTLESGYADFQNRLDGYLAQQGPDLSVGDVLGSSAIGAENFSILLGTLPYKTIAVGAVVQALPHALRWQYRFQLFADGAAQSQGQATAELRGSFAELGGKRITLSFAPASEADAATLASYMPQAHADGSAIAPAEFPAGLPAYLIRLKAELRADGVLVSSGGSFVPGSALLADIGAFEPGTGVWRERAVTVRAGDYHAVAIDAQGVAGARLLEVKARLAATAGKVSAGQAASLRRDDLAGDVLYQTALAFFATADANAEVFQRTANVVAQRLPSYGRAVAPVRAYTMLGIINRIDFPGVTLDIDRMDSAVAARTGGLAPAAFQRQSNQRDAGYARLVLAKMFTDAQHPATTVSAINALARASQDGQTIHAVTPANLAAVLPLLTLRANAKAALVDAVGAGYRVLLARAPVGVGAWEGHALQIEDPATGAGSYQLLDDVGEATANVFPALGMGWLALAQPFQSGAALMPALAAGQAIDDTLAGMLGQATTRWSYFAGKADVGNGMFLARLAAMQGAQACDTVVGILAANLGTATGYDEADGDAAAVAAPVITSVPVGAATAGQAYRYAATFNDPRGLPLTWRLVDAPAGMTVNSAGLVAWDKPVAGMFAVTLRADNGRAYADQRYVVSVGAEVLPLEISLAITPAIVNPGDTVTVTMLTNGGSGSASATVTVDGQPVALDAAGRAVIGAGAPGAHQIVVRATDSLGTIEKTSFYSVRVDGDITAPLSAITSPADDVEVTAPVNIVGTAFDANLAYYQLLLRPAGDEAWQEIGRGTASVTAGVLGKLDPTQLHNGIYELALNVVDANGAKTSSLVTVDIYRDMKIGQFAITFEDLNVEAAGIPIRVTRTYDTRRKGENLDFGYGWSVDYQSVQVRKNMVLGQQWKLERRQLQNCLMPVGSRKVNVTLPDGKVERFIAANTQECALVNLPPIDIVLNALPGTTSRMEMTNLPLLTLRNEQIYDVDSGGPWNPKHFKLTTEDNYIYYLTEGIGIVQIKDPAGHTLTYGQNGILHSNGQSVAFTRDANKRITAITDPAGKQIRYAYNGAGDMVGVTDRNESVSKFAYNRSHGLTNYTDPMGIVTARYVYDTEGRLTATYDAEGHAVETVHDTANNREIVKDRRGNETTYVYNSNGDITEKIDALKHKTTYTYDALGNAETVTDAYDKTTRSTFDPKSGKQLTEASPLGHTTNSIYDEKTRIQLQSVSDARGAVTKFSYGSNGGKSVHEPLGRNTVIAMGSGHLDTLTIAGEGTNYTYDAKGNKTTEADASGNVTTYGYDANGKEISRSWVATIDGVAKTVSLTRKLDPEGRVLEEKDALGHTSKTSYNAGGQVTSTTDPQGRTTNYEYNARGKLAKTIYPDGASETIAYDAENNQVGTTDRIDRTTQFEYDALNRLSKTIRPDGSTSGTEYDAVGRVYATIDAKLKRTVNSYDDAGRLETVTDPENKVTRFGYDENGNRTSVTNANAKITAYKYDALNRLILTTAPDGKTASIVWNVNGTKQSETDFGGNAIAFGYDPMGRLNKVTQTDGATAQETVYLYDNLGNKTSQTDAEGRTTRWTYDYANRMTGRTLPGGQTERFAYDSAGNMTAKTDFAGKTTRYGHTKTGQVNLVTRPDGTAIVTTYTASGQFETVSVTGTSGVRSGTTRYAYDAQDRLTRQTNPDGDFLAYGYDANGNIRERSTKAGTIVYDYDDNQRLASVTGTDSKATRYTYDPTGKPLTVATPNGVTAGYVYDVNGRLTQLLHRRADGGIVTGVRYTLKANGQREVIEEFDGQSTVTGDNAGNPVRTSKYKYDAPGRVTQELVADRAGSVVRTTDFTYDRSGNRKQKNELTETGLATTVYAYDANDRLTGEEKTTATGVAATSYTWDVNGNLESKTGGGVVTVYAWNSDHRLVEVKQGGAAASAQAIARYTYNADGHRVAKSEPGQSGGSEKMTTYLVDGTFTYPQTIREDVAQGAATESTHYIWGAALIEQIHAGQGRFYHADGLGSTKALSDANGFATDVYLYEAFGGVEGRTGSTANQYRYTGEYYDDTSELQYNRARWYDAAIGRFLSEDKFYGILSKPGTLNKYYYASNDPLGNSDPTGYFSLGETMSAINTASTLADLATSSYSYIFDGPEAEAEVDEPDGRVTPWDNFMAMIIRTAAASLQTASVGGGGGSGVPTTYASGGPKHHTVPEYMCGASNQDLVTLPSATHKALHDQLYKFHIAVKIGSATFDLFYRKKWPLEPKSPIANAARTPVGRIAIGTGLGLFYDNNGYMMVGRGRIPGDNLGSIFVREVAMFSGMKHSYPKCKKKK